MIALWTGDVGCCFGVCSAEGLWIGSDPLFGEPSSLSLANEGFFLMKSRVRSVNDLLRDGVCSDAVELFAMTWPGVLNCTRFEPWTRFSDPPCFWIWYSPGPGEGLQFVLADLELSTLPFKFWYLTDLDNSGPWTGLPSSGFRVCFAGSRLFIDLGKKAPSFEFPKSGLSGDNGGSTLLTGRKDCDSLVVRLGF